MELVKFNLNYNVRVRIKDRGIEHYVRKYNEIMPFHLHTSFKEFKQRADADGYHTMQMHSFMDDFGCTGLGLADLVDTNIYLFQKDVEPVGSVQQVAANGFGVYEVWEQNYRSSIKHQSTIVAQGLSAYRSAHI